MVVLRRVKIPEHCDRLELCPAAPRRYHVNAPALDLDAVLAAAATKRVGAVEHPLFVPKGLKVLRECTAEDADSLMV